MRGALLAVVTAALSHPACAPLAYQMTPSPERAEQLRVEDGVDYIVSEGAVSRVRAGAAGHNAAQEFLAVVWVENLTDADHVFLPAEHISATITRFDGEESEETPLTVYAYDAYLETLKKRAESAGTSMGVYGHSGIGFYFGGARRGPWGSSWHHPRTLSHSPMTRANSRTEHRTLAHHVAIEAAMSRAELYYADLALQRAHINATIMKRTTIAPKATHGGVVFITDGKVRKTHDATRLLLVVTVGEDVHRFSFVNGEFPTPSAD